jgi:hypothetical protein
MTGNNKVLYSVIWLDFFVIKMDLKEVGWGGVDWIDLA